MANKFKYAVGLWCLQNTADRFVQSGYLEKEYTLKELIDMAAEIPDIQGVQMISSQLVGINLKECRDWLQGSNLGVAEVIADTFSDRKFKLGSITHPDPKIRKQAIDVCKRTIEMAKSLDCSLVTLWLGSDGHDYPFQVDYLHQWETLMGSIEEIATFASGTKISLEYKLKEPRKYSTIGNAAKALNIALEAGEQVGVTLDFGHSLMSRERPAESVAFLSQYDRLFNIHINDAYGEWDDDMLVGFNNIQTTLEFLYYLDKIGYTGWIGLDIFPFRMDGLKACQISIQNLNKLLNLLDKIDYQKLANIQEDLDAGKTQHMIMNLLLKK